MLTFDVSEAREGTAQWGGSGRRIVRRRRMGEMGVGCRLDERGTTSTTEGVMAWTETGASIDVIMTDAHRHAIIHRRLHLLRIRHRLMLVIRLHLPLNKNHHLLLLTTILTALTSATHRHLQLQVILNHRHRPQLLLATIRVTLRLLLRIIHHSLLRHNHQLVHLLPLHTTDNMQHQLHLLLLHSTTIHLHSLLLPTLLRHHSMRTHHITPHRLPLQLPLSPPLLLPRLRTVTRLASRIKCLHISTRCTAHSLPPQPTPHNSPTQHRLLPHQPQPTTTTHNQLLDTDRTSNTHA